MLYSKNVFLICQFSVRKKKKLQREENTSQPIVCHRPQLNGLTKNKLEHRCYIIVTIIQLLMRSKCLDL